MKVDLNNMLRQVAEFLQRANKRDAGAYLAAIEQLREHISMVQDGRATVEQFTELYMIAPQGRGGEAKG